MATHVIVLAAGEGNRMKSDLPKVAHPVAGVSLVGWVLRAARELDSKTIVVVVGHGEDIVRAHLPGDVVVARQEEQLGTAHATRIGMAALDDIDPEDVVVILYGDVPLLSDATLSSLASLGPGDTARLVTADLEDPTGYGRVIRDDDGRITEVVEQRDCTPEQREITEINAGIYAVRAGPLLESLAQVDAQNSQGEYYLTDVVGILASKGDRLEAVKASAEEVSGINSQDQLAEAGRELRRRINQSLMESGVWMLDPERTYIDETVTVEPGARIYPGVHLEGSTTVAAGARVGPDVYANDSTIGAGSTVLYAVLRGAEIGEDCEVGPYASLRPGTVLEKGSKIGTFVEAKNTVMGEEAKANHLAYLGDAVVGARSNLGAGVVTVNYDGVEKSRTEIGEDAFVGSDTMLVAPVRVGDRASTGAGSVITNDVPDDALAIERSEQKEIPGYSR
ncbi:MAG: bifunctional UDP-N-acetylglucosamine diphosphorylase/glucosamine-1-phosphate N-acetyltransferase GlmU, partial [Actinobacteria bacterium]|nr:bifunctional UDP-N-acetylglucosamine diphosphorylase/glucosamine-1-phosphate N-acetyltransferase GlmU [Actinomycetota bacterium]